MKQSKYKSLMKNKFMEEEQKHMQVYRKYHFWRGFIVASVLWFVVSVYFLDYLLTLLK